MASRVRAAISIILLPKRNVRLRVLESNTRSGQITAPTSATCSSILPRPKTLLKFGMLPIYIMYAVLQIRPAVCFRLPHQWATAAVTPFSTLPIFTNPCANLRPVFRTKTSKERCLRMHKASFRISITLLLRRHFSPLRPNNSRRFTALTRT